MYEDQNGTRFNQNSGSTYHYVYRQNEPTDNGPELKKKKKTMEFGWGKLIALMLVCALLGGCAGAGILLSMRDIRRGAEEIAESDRTVKEVDIIKVDGKKQMTEVEAYAANVNSAVSINVSGMSTNAFGYSTETASAGSGFIVTADGYIVTNYHVISGGRSVKVTLYNGNSYDAEIIGGDEDYDIAVIKINAADLQAVTFGDSDKLNVGEKVLAIGNPLGELTFSMSEGIVSCVNRAINVDGTPFNMIQIDASVNPGNSGGPLLNTYGEVIGIVSAKYSTYSTTTVEGLGFAIPINDVLAMVQDIMENGYVTDKAYLGITAQTINASQAKMYDNLLREGVYVRSVEKNGPADAAGVKEGDIIVKLNETVITSMADLTAAKKSFHAGDTAVLTVYRDGSEQALNITFGSMPKETETEDSSQQSGTDGNSGGQDFFDYYRDYFFGNGGFFGDGGFFGGGGFGGNDSSDPAA